MSLTIDRYIAKKYLMWFFVITGVLFFVIGLFELMEFLRRAVGRPYVLTSSLLKLTALKMPFHFLAIYPFICMITTLITLSRLNHDQEIIAMRSFGISVLRIVFSLIVCVGGLSVFVLGVINPISAITQRSVSKMELSVFSNNASDNQLLFDDSGLWLREKIEGGARIIKVERYDALQKRFINVDIVETTDSGAFKKRYRADSSILENNHWHLKNTKEWSIDNQESSVTDACLETDYSLEKIHENNVNPETISFWELPKFISLLNYSGLSSVRYELHWFAQIAKIIQSFALILLACVFCLKPTRYYKATLLIFYGIVLAFGLHFLTDVIHALGKSYKLPLALSAFSPALITSFLSMGLLFRSEHG